MNQSQLTLKWEAAPSVQVPIRTLGAAASSENQAPTPNLRARAGPLRRATERTRKRLERTAVAGWRDARSR